MVGLQFGLPDQDANDVFPTIDIDGRIAGKSFKRIRILYPQRAY
jgi:hypothetical protein